MAKPVLLLVNIPFSGFYESKWSQAIDQEEERHIEYSVTDTDMDREDNECRHPKPLRLNEKELFEIYARATDYRVANKQIARCFVDDFNTYWSDVVGFPLRLTFESMTSPREYNFQTDRIFCHIPASVVRGLFILSKREGHQTLAKVLKERHTSYDGFVSFYSNSVEAWLVKPLDKWDWNELGSLLRAVMTMRADADSEDPEWTIYEGMSEGDEFHTAWSNAVNWKKVAELCADARADKLEALRESDPETAAILAGESEEHYRCPLTRDLFEGETVR